MKDHHPNLYNMYMVYAVLSIAMGLNFIFLNPSFDPFGVPKEVVGATFLGCGVTKASLLLWVRSATMLRLSMALSVAIMSFWSGVLTVDFFLRSLTSLQLPLTYIGLAVLGFLLIVEPFTNPATERANGDS